MKNNNGAARTWSTGKINRVTPQTIRIPIPGEMLVSDGYLTTFDCEVYTIYSIEEYVRWYIK